MANVGDLVLAHGVDGTIEQAIITMSLQGLSSAWRVENAQGQRYCANFTEITAPYSLLRDKPKASAKMVQHVHNWQPLYQRPSERNSQALRIDWLFLPRSCADMRVCPDCGHIGCVSGGRQRGGGHRVMDYREQEDSFVQMHRQGAQVWNARVQEDLLAV